MPVPPPIDRPLPGSATSSGSIPLRLQAPYTPHQRTSSNVRLPHWRSSMQDQLALAMPASGVRAFHEPGGAQTAPEKQNLRSLQVTTPRYARHHRQHGMHAKFPVPHYLPEGGQRSARHHPCSIDRRPRPKCNQHVEGFDGSWHEFLPTFATLAGQQRFDFLRNGLAGAEDA